VGRERVPLDLRLAVRFPALSDRLLAMAARERPGSMLRRRLVKRGFARGMELLNRDRLDALMRFGYEPDFEMRVVGFGPAFTERYHGLEGFYAFDREFREAFGHRSYRVEELIDLGDRLLARVSVVMEGAASGVQTMAIMGWIYYMSAAGKIARQDFVWTWEEAAASVGLPV
jgi:SnoaL-like domain